jgi:hypothetical protein
MEVTEPTSDLRNLSGDDVIFFGESQMTVDALVAWVQAQDVRWSTLLGRDGRHQEQQHLASVHATLR